jgi:hypothetical protein
MGTPGGDDGGVRGGEKARCGCEVKRIGFGWWPPDISLLASQCFSPPFY